MWGLLLENRTFFNLMDTYIEMGATGAVLHKTCWRQPHSLPNEKWVLYFEFSSKNDCIIQLAFCDSKADQINCMHI